MSATEQFVAEICMFPFNFTPKGWARCDGQLMPISQNTALFSLLGTIYGGNGQSTFALPDLQGRVPIQRGQGQGLSFRDVGEMGGQRTVILLETEMPVHTHPGPIKIPAGGDPNTDSPLNAYPATFSDGAQVGGYAALFYSDGAQNMGTVNSETSSLPAGGGLPHNNIQPTLFVNYCIALQGIFPPRS